MELDPTAHQIIFFCIIMLARKVAADLCPPSPIIAAQIHVLQYHPSIHPSIRALSRQCECACIASHHGRIAREGSLSTDDAEELAVKDEMSLGPTCWQQDNPSIRLV